MFDEPVIVAVTCNDNGIINKLKEKEMAELEVVRESSAPVPIWPPLISCVDLRPNYDLSD
jgi:hypothetical protein